MVYFDSSLVRVLHGSPERTHPEPRILEVEQFLAMLRFEQRDKVAILPLAELQIAELQIAELPDDWMKERS